MTEQKSEGGVVPEGVRKGAPTSGVEARRGGKAVPVSKQMRQLELPFATAENPCRPQGPGDKTRFVWTDPAKEPGPKAKVHAEPTSSTMMEAIVAELRPAFDSVASNRGAPGPDKQTIAWVREHLDDLLPKLGHSLLEGTYRPGAIRRVYIPKASGGQRGLGIPNVVDRMVQEAVRRVLEPQYEPTFHPSSHGFRPGRSCHTAIAEAKSYLEEGCEWVVDIDLSKFFDRVSHQRLLGRLGQRINERDVLQLIHRMLKAKVVLPDGVVMGVEEGVPQGGPLSPLLSNIVLDELDRELAQRGHRFVRYADDCNIYVRSERAGRRVMESVTRFIERRLRLKVNQDKSAVARPRERHFLGFRLRRESSGGTVEVLLSARSLKRAFQRIRELTPRTWGNSLSACIRQVNVYLKGWFNFFGICTAKTLRDLAFGTLDARIRRRLRAIQLKQWKRKRTIVRRLISLGVRPKSASRNIYTGRRSIWALSHNLVVERGLRNAYFAERGLVSLLGLWRARQRIKEHRAIVVSSTELVPQLSRQLALSEIG